MLAEASPKELFGGGAGGGGGADDPGVAMLMLLLVVPIAGRLLDLLLGYGATEESVVEGIGGTTGLEPRIGKAGVVSSLIEREVAAFPAERSSTRWLTVRIGEKPELEPAPDIVIAAVLLSLDGLARPLPLVMFAPGEDMRPELVGGAVSVVYDPLPLPPLWYEPAVVPVTASDESIVGLPAPPS